MCCYVRCVSQALDSLRRSTRNTLLFTDICVGLLPLGFVLQPDSYPGLLRFSLIVAGTVCFVVLHARGVLQAINGEWQPFPLRRSYGLAGLGTAVACVGTSVDAGVGTLSGMVLGMAASEFSIARPFRLAWRHIGTVVAMHVAGTTLVAVLTGPAEEAGPPPSWPPPANASAWPRTCTTSSATHWKSSP
jgi:hypothetical protein